MIRFFGHILGRQHDNTTIISSFVRDGLMQYDLIFSCPKVLGNLAFCWLYKTIYGIYPSVLDFKNDNIQNIQSIQNIQ